MAKVMIVEDNVTTANILKDMLKRMSHEISGWIQKGEEALDAIQKKRPDIILMDIDLAGKWDGVETANHISDEFDIPIIYTTSNINLDVNKASDSSYGYLLKPYSDEELRINLEIALHKHELDRKLKRSQRYIYNIIQAMSDALLVISHEGIIQTVNKAAEQLLSLSAADLLGKPINTILRTEKENNLTGEISGMEVEYADPAGRTRYFLRKRNWAKSDLGKQLYGIETLTDITKLKELEAYILRTEKEKMLHDKDTMDFINWKEMYGAKDTAVFEKVMYSLNTSVNSMGGPMLLEFMISNIQEENGRYFFDETIYQALRELDTELRPLFSNLAEIDRIMTEETDMEEVDTREMVEMTRQVVAKNQKTAAEHKHIISVDSQVPLNDPAFCRISKAYFQECMEELIINAMKYSPEGEKIWIDIYATKDRIKVDVINVAGEYTIGTTKVMGIPYEFSEIVFNPFERLKRNINFYVEEKWHYGLGLFVVRKLIEKMEGKVRCHDGLITILSQKEKPITTFKIRLKRIRREQ